LAEHAEDGEYCEEADAQIQTAWDVRWGTGEQAEEQ